MLTVRNVTFGNYRKLFYFLGDGQLIVARGCAEINNTVQSVCDIVNQQGGNCTICDTNLCNGNNDAEEIFVDECYYCTGTCDSLEVQNCKELLGENAQSKCIAMEYVGGKIYPI